MNNVKCYKPGDLKQGSDEWLEWRRCGIGGTDVGGIMDCSKWSSPLAVYNNKINPVHEKTEKTVYQEWGNRIEPLLIDKWAENHSAAHTIQRGYMYQKDVWMKCSLDAECILNGVPCIIECKTARSASDWNPIPEYYRAQVMWQMLITGYRKAWFSVLVNGSEWFEVECPWDETYANHIYTTCKYFWDTYIIPLIPPPTSTHPANDQDALVNLLSVSKRCGQREIDKKLAHQFIAAKENLDMAQKLFDKAKALIAHEMQDGHNLTYDGKLVAQYIERAGSTTIDSKLLKAKYPEIFAECSKRGNTISYIKYL